MKHILFDLIPTLALIGVLSFITFRMIEINRRPIADEQQVLVKSELTKQELKILKPVPERRK
jgi:hypothetical protein